MSNSASRRSAPQPPVRPDVSTIDEATVPVADGYRPGKELPGIYRSKPMLKTVGLPSAGTTDGTTMQDVPKPPRAMLEEPRRGTGPTEDLGEDERRLLVDTMSQDRPRIEIDE